MLSRVVRALASMSALGTSFVSRVEGDVPVPPYPSWTLTDQALVSLGRLVRGYHDAVTRFDTSGLIGWSGECSDPGGGPTVCHNDLFRRTWCFVTS